MQEYFNIKKLNVIKVKIDVANTGHITNCYVIWDTNNNAVVIDPAFDADKIVQVIQDNNLKIRSKVKNDLICEIEDFISANKSKLLKKIA